MLLVSLALAALPAWSAEGGWGLAELMRSFKAVDSSRSRFSERRELAILSRPLESSGTLVYRAPGRLEKHTLVPERESLVLDGGTLMLENGERGSRESFALRDHPVIRAFVEAIRSTLAGDLATLQRFYEVKLEGDDPHWQLTLEPLGPEMKAVIDRIVISGSGAWISRVDVREKGGDRSVMMISREGS